MSKPTPSFITTLTSSSSFGFGEPPRLLLALTPIWGGGVEGGGGDFSSFSCGEGSSPTRIILRLLPPTVCVSITSSSFFSGGKRGVSGGKTGFSGKEFSDALFLFRLLIGGCAA